MYLNLAPYGNQYAGAERASRGYFGVPAAHAHAGAGRVSCGAAAAAIGFQPVSQPRCRDQTTARRRSPHGSGRRARRQSGHMTSLNERLSFAAA